MGDTARLPPPRPSSLRLDPPTYAEGVVVSGKGFGFLREPRRNFSQSNNDVFVTPEVVRKHALRDGMWIKGETRRGSRGPQLFKLVEIEGRDPDNFQNLPVFEELTTISPNKRIRLETTPDRYTTRVMDLMTPIKASWPDCGSAACWQDHPSAAHRRCRGQKPYRNEADHPACG
jgi:transcription termination factor Rho